MSVEKINYIEYPTAASVSEDYAEILEREPHHRHKIVEINDVYRWEEVPNSIGIAFLKAYDYETAVDKLFELSLIDDFAKSSFLSTKDVKALTELCHKKIDLNTIVTAFFENDIDKNNEIWREMYRGIGYSLSGYWEIFYWDMNNEEAHLYEAPISVQ